MASGDILYAADFGTPATDIELTDETAFTSTSYIAGGTPTGTTFVAPTSGVVMVMWHARFQSNTAAVRACVSVSVRTGSTLGSGTVVSGSDDDSCIETPQDGTGGANTRLSCCMFRRVSGLTAGSTYNVQVEHKVLAAGNGTIFARSVDVQPIATA